MDNTVFFFISSKSDNNPGHSGLMEVVRASGLFRIHNLVTICAECRRNGVITACLHAPKPAWQDFGTQSEKAKVLMLGDTETMNREMFNLDDEASVEPAFNHEALSWIQKDTEKWTYPKYFEKDYVFVGIDPACGGRYSRHAIVSAVLHRDTISSPEKLVVCTLKNCCLLWEE